MSPFPAILFASEHKRKKGKVALFKNIWWLDAPEIKRMVNNWNPEGKADSAWLDLKALSKRAIPLWQCESLGSWWGGCLTSASDRRLLVKGSFRNQPNRGYPSNSTRCYLSSLGHTGPGCPLLPIAQLTLGIYFTSSASGSLVHHGNTNTLQVFLLSLPSALSSVLFSQ